MVVTLIALHFLCFSVALGGGVANAVIGARMELVDPPQRPIVGGTARLIGKISFGALILLWVTGLLLTWILYGSGQGLPATFAMKIIAVAFLTICAVAIQVLAMRAEREQKPPPAETIAKLGKLITASGVIAIILAVATFN